MFLHDYLLACEISTVRTQTLRVGYMGTAFPLFCNKIMSKLSQNVLIEGLTST